jgi:hypothetical protein
MGRPEAQWASPTQLDIYMGLGQKGHIVFGLFFLGPIHPRTWANGLVHQADPFFTALGIPNGGKQN